jgi:hypothetical protein
VSKWIVPDCAHFLGMEKRFYTAWANLRHAAASADANPALSRSGEMKSPAVSWPGEIPLSVTEPLP